MPLITIKSIPKFDLAAVQQRDFIRAQYHTWDGPRNGLVTAAGEDRLTVIFLPAINNVTCYFEIKAQEVQDGKWSIRWSRDLSYIEEVDQNGNIGGVDSAAAG